MSKLELADLGNHSSMFDSIDREELERKAHSSPFERFKSRYPGTRFEDMYPIMQFKGNLAQLVDELQMSLENPQSGTNFVNIALHPPRIIRAVLDYKIGNPNKEVSEELVEKALSVGLAVYEDDHNTSAALKDFRTTLDEQMLGYEVEQIADAPTWHATDPELSFRTSQKLRYQVENQDILLVALGHGGVAAGIDVFLYYQKITGSADSRFYVTRFSRRKHNDLFPRISDREFDLLRTIAQDRQVVVFDEDSVSGGTLEIATDTFADVLAPLAHPIVAVKNMNIVGKTEKALDSSPMLINHSHIRLDLIENLKNSKRER